MNIYTGNDKHRYILGNCPDNKIGENTLFCIGVNPSIASNTKSDPTWTRVQKMASKNDFSNAIMINLYPQRATNFDNLHLHMDDALHLKNIASINDILNFNNANIWCAWGNLIKKRSFLIKCLSDIHAQVKHLNINWFHLGNLTKDNNPMHPIARGRNGFSYQLSFSKFDIENYLGIKN
jgi:serine/threonine protein phosphatase 1